MFARIWDFVVAHYQARRLAEELASMDDRTLADFGITRGDITTLARDEAARLEGEFASRRSRDDGTRHVFGGQAHRA